MTGSHDVFLSYSRNDLAAAVDLRAQLERRGLAVFRDEDKIREGELWLDRLQEEVTACRSFVVLVGRDGVGRWIGAETQAALSRYFGPHDDAQRLPIYPILLGETDAATLPAFLLLFQSTRWNGTDPLPETLLDRIRDRKLAAGDRDKFEGCPFVGLDAFRMDQAQLFFGRQKETLDALACFDTRRGSPTIRWLEINGNSGCGKSSLMNAGLLPLVDQGWLWPRTNLEHWRLIGPMMPGKHPVAMLAEQLARAFAAEMADVRSRLESDGPALAMWLRGRKQDETAFLLAIDQFEELFTFADPDERARFDGLLAGALEDADCPLFVISTVRADFLDRFEDLRRLVALRNRSCRPWTLAPIGSDGLREVIEGPARLAGLDASEVQEAMVGEARDEPGALPLVENALQWLWEQRKDKDNRLSGRLFTDRGGLAGILSQSADGLLDGLGKQREQALDLLFGLVKVDPESRRHTRQRMPYAEAVAVAGGGERGGALLGRLSGERPPDALKARGQLRLITVMEAEGGDGAADQGRWVNLIHEMLVRSKGLDAAGKPQPYWPTLWRYVEQHKRRAARRERLELLAREWKERTGPARIFGLAGWRDLFGFRGLAAPGSIERRYLHWSAARAMVVIVLLAVIVGFVGESAYWTKSHDLPLEALTTRWAYKVGEDMPLPDFPDEPVPKGQFKMGGDRFQDEQPIHPVVFAQLLYFTRTEITVAQFRPFAEATGRSPPSGAAGDPVTNVDWGDASAYARWLTAMTGNQCRLPSEAEWEYACRAGTTTEYALPAPNGSDDIAGKRLANCIGCGSESDKAKVAPVGSFPANGWGLRDMHGNVWEWVEDCWHEDYKGAPGDGQAWREANGGQCGPRVLRGGSWFSLPILLRCANRYGSDPVFRDYFIGFRVVCSSPSF